MKHDPILSTETWMKTELKDICESFDEEKLARLATSHFGDTVDFLRRLDIDWTTHLIWNRRLDLWCRSQNHFS